MTTFRNSKVDPRVRKGVAWLQKKHPGWFHRVSLRRLAMTNCRDCVIGQLCGNFWDQMGSSHNMSLQEAASLGFYIRPAAFGWAKLTEEWKNAIRILRLQFPRTSVKKPKK